jgi:hypothetical protein
MRCGVSSTCRIRYWMKRRVRRAARRNRRRDLRFTSYPLCPSLPIRPSHRCLADGNCCTTPKRPITAPPAQEPSTLTASVRCGARRYRPVGDKWAIVWKTRANKIPARPPAGRPRCARARAHRVKTEYTRYSRGYNPRLFDVFLLTLDYPACFGHYFGLFPHFSRNTPPGRGRRIKKCFISGNLGSRCYNA